MIREAAGEHDGHRLGGTPRDLCQRIEVQEAQRESVKMWPCGSAGGPDDAWQGPEAMFWERLVGGS